MTLDSRKGRILQAIVNDYVETAEPIGSEWLVSHHNFGCKSATLRNEMAEMSDMGYLMQPHTSAGRIPSHLGYRYYVDCLMVTEPLSVPESRRALRKLPSATVAVEELVQLTCRLLAEMTRYPSLATAPSASSASFHRVYLTPAAERRVLVVLLFSTGHVEHRLLELDAAVNEDSLQRTTNFLNVKLAGCELSDLQRSVLDDLPSELPADRTVAQAVHASIVETARTLMEDRVLLEGTTHILRQREFHEVLRLERLLAALEQGSILSHVFGQAAAGQDVTVIIGPESRVEAMQDCSVVTSRYRIGDRTGGFIGVFGPTRMNYERAVTAVEFMARNLSSLLTRAAIG